MFPPASPMTERTRAQNEMRELERRASRQAHVTPKRLSLPLPRISFAGVTAAIRSLLNQARPQAQPPVRDCR